jgi:hypothetical protein
MRGFKQCAQFGFCVDVWDETPVGRTKETSWWNLRRRILALAKAGETAKNPDAARLGKRRLKLRSLCPCDSERHR